MFTKSRAFAAMAAGAGALILVGAAPATAAPAGSASNGAQTYHYNECQDFGNAVVCYLSHGEYNSVSTPSGNTVFQSNGMSKYTVTFDNGESYSGRNSSNYHVVWKEGETQVFHDRWRSTQEFNGQKCTYGYTFHYANGEVRIDDQHFNCQ